MTHETRGLKARGAAPYPSSQDLEAQQVLELPNRQALSLIPSDLTALLANPSLLGGGATGATPQPAASPTTSVSSPLLSKFDPSRLSIL